MIMLFLLLWPVLITAQVCSRITLYNDCINKRTLDIMNCELIIKAPSPDYYQCLCDNNKKMYDCYSYCPTDTTLSLESQKFQLNVQAVCQQAEAAKVSASLATITTTTTTTPSTSAGEPLAIATTTVPPSIMTDHPHSTISASKERPTIAFASWGKRRQDYKWSRFWLISVSISLFVIFVLSTSLSI